MSDDHPASRSETSPGWWAQGVHRVDHAHALGEAREQVREAIEDGLPWPLSERVRVWQASGGPVEIIFHEPPIGDRQRSAHYGIWTFAGCGPDHSADVADILFRTGTGCAVHRFPARLAAGGTLFRLGDPHCPGDAAPVMVFDAVCQWDNWRDTALVSVGDPAARTVGPLQEVDLDESWLASVMPVQPRPRRHRRIR